MKMLRSAAFILVLLLVGCATTDKFQTPHLTIVAAGMTSADVFSEQFRVRVHVDNPNAREMPIKGIDYKLFLEGDIFAEGASAAPFVVPANGRQEFDLIVHTHFVSSIGRLLARISGTDRHEIQYNFEGTVTLDLPFSPKLKFNDVGTVDLMQR